MLYFNHELGTMVLFQEYFDKCFKIAAECFNVGYVEVIAL